MLGFVKTIFSSDKALGLVDKVFNGADKLVFTNEERVEGKINVLKAYEPFKLAQRLIALLLVGGFIIGFLCALIFVCISFWNPEALKVVESVKELMVSTVVTPVSIVVGFYYLGGVNNFRKK